VSAALTYVDYVRLVRESGPPRMAWLSLDELAAMDDRVGFAVHLTFHKELLVLVRGRGRGCWEFPGGRRDPGETILQTAQRELAEECGAAPARIRPWCGYQVRLADRVTQGLFCWTEMESLPGPPPESEVEEARTFARLPNDWCYPHIQGRLLQACLPALSTRGLIQAPSALPGGLLSILADSPPPEGLLPPPPANR
jgi:8-oxo-dGTP diphosphatase